MGNGSAHSDRLPADERNPLGDMRRRDYFTKGYIDTFIIDENGESIPIRAKHLGGLGKEGGDRGSPHNSNSPFSVYLDEDKEGKFQRVRFYDAKGDPRIDLDLHDPGKRGGSRLHYHEWNNEITQTVKGKKKTGRPIEHPALSEDMKKRYRYIIEILGKRPDEIDGYYPITDPKK